MPTEQSHIETSKAGTRCLIVYYTGNKYDEAIRAAEERFDVVGERLAVIALPDHRRSKNRRANGQRSVCRRAKMITRG